MGDPSRTIADIENVEYVFKDGKGYDPKKLIESVKGMVGSRVARRRVGTHTLTLTF